MIEKRFVFVIDNGEDTFYDLSENGEIMNMIDTEDMLNKLNEENERLKKVLGSILIEVRRDISITNYIGEIKVFINPNSFELISEVLRKYGALKEWYK